METKAAIQLLAFMGPLVIAPAIVYRRIPDGDHVLWYWCALVALVALMEVVGRVQLPGLNEYWSTAAVMLLMLVLWLATTVKFFLISPLAGIASLLPILVLLPSYLFFRN